MDQKTILKIIGVIVVIAALFLLITKGGTEKSVTVDENLEGNLTEETQKVNNEISDYDTPREMSFEHTNPGVSSEVYYTVGNLEPNTTYTAKMGSLESGELWNIKEQTVTVDEFGVARFVWEINQFGDYGVTDEESGYQYTERYVTVE